MANEKEATLLLKIKTAGKEVLEGFLDRLVITAGDVVGAFQKVGGAVIDLAKQSITAYAEQERAVNELSTAMISQGIFSEELKNKYIAMSEALQKTTAFGDEQIISAQAVLQSYVGQKEVTQELIQATLDFAAAKKVDLASAAELIGKTIGGTINSLSRYGVEVTDSTDKTARMGDVIDNITQKWDGQSEAQIKGLGIMGQVSKSWGELIETIGQRLTPIVVMASEKLIGLFDVMNNFIRPGAEESSLSIQQLRAKIYGLGESIDELQRKKDAASTPADQQQFQWRIDQEKAALEQVGAMLAEAQATKDLNQQNANATEIATMQQHSVTKQEQMLLDMEMENSLIGANAEQVINAQLQRNSTELKAATDHRTKMRLMNEREDLLKSQNAVKTNARILADQKIVDAENLKQQQSFFSTVQTLSNSNNKALAAAGKAASIAQIAMKTPEAVANAYAFGTRTGGPILGGIFGGMAAVAMAAQASKIAGVQLAEGGIVKATPGGVQATIGEGGQDEAVIPLPKGGGMPGGNITINVYGGMLGDESSAREFASAVDKQLFYLRRDNASMAFDSGII